MNNKQTLKTNKSSFFNLNNNFLSRLRNNYKNLPNALTGLALGFVGLSTLIDLNIQTFVANWSNWVSIPFFIIVILLLVLSTLRNFLNLKTFIKELKDPLLSSFFCTYSMVVMSIAGFIASWNKTIAISPGQIIGAIIMIFGLIIQLYALFVFLKNIVIKYKFHAETVYGSWFLPSVGISIAALNAHNFNNAILPNIFFQIIWYFAFVSYILLFIAVTYQLLFRKEVTKEKFPSIAVYFAPAGLIAASFISCFAIPYASNINEALSNMNHLIFQDNSWYITSYSSGFITVTLVILIAISFTYSLLLWTVFVIRILRQKFSYIFASLTFPTAINAIANVLCAKFINLWILHTNGHSLILNNIYWCFLIVGYIFSITSTFLIMYIAISFFTNILVDFHFKTEWNSLKENLKEIDNSLLKNQDSNTSNSSKI
ncbi:MAG: hypothetical protein IIT78_02660 [Mycoplasmataceae bacterium]|nr:hypothetical protein [Mycoplasmataceae bacterium]